MRIPVKKVIYASALCLIFLLITGGIMTVAKRRQRPLPPIISKVKQLKVVGVTVERPDEDTATAVIEIKNTSDKSVIAVAVEVGEGNDASGINRSGIGEGDRPPSVVIEPHGSTEVRFPISHLRYYKPGTPIKVSGAMFSDGTEEGDEETLGTMRRQKEHDKAGKSEKERGVSQQ